jgi:UDP:flavonoid glycosyltransferase YjiC (YdhE family)
VYKDFRNSSNMPGKAAAFGKPILVSDKYLMGERVRHYGLGAAVPEDNPEAILAAIESVIQSPPLQENFATYKAMHNEEVMGRALERFFTACLQDIKNSNFKRIGDIQ